MVDIIESVCLTVVINLLFGFFHFGFLALFRCAFLKTKYVFEVQQFRPESGNTKGVRS